MKIQIYFVGKPRDQHANAIAAEFLKRAGRWAKCEMREIHPDRFEARLEDNLLDLTSTGSDEDFEPHRALLQETMLPSLVK